MANAMMGVPKWKSKKYGYARRERADDPFAGVPEEAPVRWTERDLDGLLGPAGDDGWPTSVNDPFMGPPEPPRYTEADVEGVMDDAGLPVVNIRVPVEARRLRPVVSGTIMRNRRPATVWTSGPDGPVQVETGETAAEELTGWESGRGRYQPMTEEEAVRLGLEGEPNEGGRTPWKYERYEPMSVEEARAKGLLMESGDNWAGSITGVKGARRITAALQAARRRDDAQMSVRQTPQEAEERALRWNRSGPTSRIDRDVRALREARLETKRRGDLTERAVAVAREEARAAEALAGTRVPRGRMTDAQYMTQRRYIERIRKGDIGVTADPETADAMLAQLNEMRPDLADSEGTGTEGTQGTKGLPTVTSQAQWDALKKGAEYLDAKGNRKRKA